MKIIILGGDGFCGWASSLRLANKGHDVFIFDNLSRRKIDKELKNGLGVMLDDIVAGIYSVCILLIIFLITDNV